MAALTRTWQPIPQALFLWLTAQLCCVWIRPRIKQEVEIKQKLKHTRRNTHSRRHCESGYQRLGSSSSSKHEWQPVEKVHTPTRVHHHAHTHTHTNMLQYVQSHTLPPTDSHKPRQDHRHIISLCPHSCSNIWSFYSLSASLPRLSSSRWSAGRLMRKTSKYAQSVVERASEITLIWKHFWLRDVMQTFTSTARMTVKKTRGSSDALIAYWKYRNKHLEEVKTKS